MKTFSQDAYGAFSDWLENFETKLRMHASLLSVGDDTILSISLGVKAMSATIAVAAEDTADEDAFITRELVINEYLFLFFLTAADLRKAALYTSAIGNDIGIDAPVFDLFIRNKFLNGRLELTANVYPDLVTLQITGPGVSGVSGVDIYTRLKDERLWKRLSYEIYSPYADTRPVPQDTEVEHRQYVAVGVLTGNINGPVSNIIDVTVKR